MNKHRRQTCANIANAVLAQAKRQRKLHDMIGKEVTFRKNLTGTLVSVTDNGKRAQVRVGTRVHGVPVDLIEVVRLPAGVELAY